MDHEARAAILKRYSDGGAGTRDTIEQLGMQDYADLLIALAQADLPFPPPADTPRIRADRERAAAILGPLLRRGA
jgi:hypothetical protein